MENKILDILDKVVNDARHKWSSHSEEESSIKKYAADILELTDNTN